MDTEYAECLNTGFLEPEYVKNVTHAFCAAVEIECRRVAATAEYECRRTGIADLEKGYDRLRLNLIRFSRDNSEESGNGVKPIDFIEDDLLAYFFNQKNKIPNHVYYWFNRYYNLFFGQSAVYKYKHTKTYNALQRLYIKRYRLQKYSEKETAQANKELRRKVSKAFCSGEYSAVFKLYNTDFINSVSKKQFESISELIPLLFPKKLSICKDDGEAAALGYIIGHIQGASEAAEAAQSTGNKLSDAIIDKVSKCTDKHILFCIHSFISSLVF